MIQDAPPSASSATMLYGDFHSESIACVVDTSHSASQADMDDMGMKRGAANKRDKHQRQNKDES